MANEKGGEWQFINLGKANTTKTSDVRKKIRVNAMLHYRRSQKGKTGSGAGDAALDHSSEAFGETHANPLGLLYPVNSKDRREQEHPWIMDTGPNWPNEWDQLLNAAQTMSCSMLPQAALGNMLDDIDEWESCEQRGFNASAEIPAIYTAQASYPNTIFRAGNADPFNSFPHSNGVQSSELLHHCKQPARPASAR